MDAPYALYGIAAAAVLSLAAAVALLVAGWWLGWLVLVSGVYSALSAASFAYTTLRGKFVVWRRELAGSAASGSVASAALDLGCGRGAVLVLAAAVAGRVTGVDLWRSVDQSGNDEARTRANLVAAGVSDRVDLITADLRDLPLAGGAYDLVVSSLAIHNIPDAAGREVAVGEAYRVLAPGGRLLIADFRHAPAYAAVLTGLGAAQVSVRGLGWRFWYGGPWAATSMLTARRPG